MCRKVKTSKFEPLKPEFEGRYRARDGLYPCCIECWPIVGSEDQGSPPKKRRITPPTTPQSSKVEFQEIGHPPCDLCTQKRACFRTFEPTSNGFETCNFLKQLLGGGERREDAFAVCKACYKENLSIRTALQELASRLGFEDPPEASYFSSCVFQCNEKTSTQLVFEDCKPTMVDAATNTPTHVAKF